MKFFARNVLIFSVMLVMSACSSDTMDNTGGAIVDPDPPGMGGNGDPVSYSAQIQPIFSASCGGSSCHIPGPRNGVSLENYAAVVASAGSQYLSLVVLPGNAAESPLIDKLGGAPQFGQQMPDGGASLSLAQVQLIATWIDEGAQNN
jgi:hypothetical protein